MLLNNKKSTNLLINKYFCIISLVFFIISCTSSDRTVIKMREIDATLTGTEVPISTFIYKPRGIALTNDKLVIHDDIEENKFKFFSYPNIEYLFSWGKKGKGPDEIRFVSSSGFGATDSTFRFLEIDVLKEYKVNPDNKINLVHRTSLMNTLGPLNGFNVLDDSLYLATLVDELDPSSEHVFLFPNGARGQSFGTLPEENLEFDFFTQKAIYYHKTNVINESERKIMVFYVRLNLMKIYNYEGELIKEVEFNGYTMGKKKPSYWTTFSAPYGTDKFVYVFYTNDIKGENLDDLRSITPELLVWSWDGELVKRFVLDKPVIWFVVSEKYGKIYGIDIIGENKIYEFSLPGYEASYSSSYDFETDFYKTKIPDGWEISHNITNKNKIYDRNVDYNKNLFLFNNAINEPCGATITIDTYFPEKSDSRSIDEAYNIVYGRWFDENKSNYHYMMDTIKGLPLPRYYFEFKASYPQNQQVKQTGWIWKDKTRVYHVRLNGCEDFEQGIEKVKLVIANFEAK